MENIFATSRKRRHRRRGLKANVKWSLDVHLTWPFAAPLREMPASPAPEQLGSPGACVYLVTQLPLRAPRLHLAVFTLRLYFRLCRVYLGEMYFTNYYVSALLRALCNEIKALPE